MINIFAVAMKFASFVCACMFLCSPAFSASDGEGIAGNYGLHKGTPTNGIQIILECTKEVVCRYTTTSQWKGETSRQVQVLDKIAPLIEMDAVRNALAYAVEQRNRTITHEDFAESMRQLRPALDARPEIEKCWDLNDPVPRYTVVCKLSHVSAEDSSALFLFMALLASCGQAFCAYVINRMESLR